MWRFLNFEITAVRHLRFIGIQIFQCRYGFQCKYVSQCHIFRADRPSRCRDMVVFRFFNMATVWTSLSPPKRIYIN